MKLRLRWLRWLFLALVLGIVAVLAYAVIQPDYEAAMRDTAANGAEVVARAVGAHHRTYGTYPPTVSALAPPLCRADCPLDQPPRDPWGNEFFLREQGGVRSVCSAGPDGDPATDADNICSKPQ